MNIKWIRLSDIKEGCLLGNICIGGVIQLGWDYYTAYQVDLRLPGNKVDYKVFDTSEKCKSIFEKAVADWLTEAGLK